MPLKITVIGTGYLGATHSAALAELGFEVLGVDNDREKIERLRSGVLPFFEPGLPELLRKHTSSGRLRFSTSLEEAADFGDVHFIAVGTPQRRGEHAADMSYVESAVASLCREIRRPSVVVGKSTVPVGTSRKLTKLVSEITHQSVDLAWNPEFLREGFAVQDSIHPDRIVVGTDSQRARECLRQIYAPITAGGVPMIETDFETAELVKVAANAFLATKISFINAFSEMTEVVGGDISTLADALGLDERIGRRFLNAGIGFGGGCLPKDIRALQARASELGLDQSMQFLREVDEINLRRRDRTVLAASSVLEGIDGARVAVLGVTFKPNSDDVRDSPALDVAGRLYNQGVEVQVYDPQGNANSARRYPRLSYCDSQNEAIDGADLVLLLTEWQEFRELAPSMLEGKVRRKNILDGRNVLNAEEWVANGWNFLRLGSKIAL